ncbi:MAG: hypothetical protein K2M62_09480 [Muribaculaceae bacterium]|nr:hypothetical protein [Muribaculaceae bacterium]
MSTENNNEKIYIVNFGNSDRYIIRENPAGEASKLAAIEAELNAFLRSKFPDETFAYFTTPKVEEINPDQVGEYENYPALDAEAVEAIKKVLEDEVENMEANRKLNDNSPFANVNPAAADIPHILG